MKRFKNANSWNGNSMEVDSCGLSIVFAYKYFNLFFKTFNFKASRKV